MRSKIDTRISNESASCFLIKHSESTPLYSLCDIFFYSSLKILDYDGFEGDDIHYKYNFILKPGRM